MSSRGAMDVGTEAGRKFWELETDVMLGRLTLPQVMERVRDMVAGELADRSEIDRLERELENANREADDKDGEIRRLEDEIKYLDKQIARLKRGG